MEKQIKKDLKNIYKKLKSLKKLAKNDPEKGIKESKDIQKELEKYMKLEDIKKNEKIFKQLKKIHATLIFYRDSINNLNNFKKKWDVKE
jgi:hypothetical protein